MRRASTLASFNVLSRSLATVHGGAVATSASPSHSLLQVALYGTSSTTGPHVRRRWFDSFSGGPAGKLAIGVAGTLASVAVASSLTQEVYAKEPPPAELVPKDVVLYQYEACPFCNKVKAIIDKLNDKIVPERVAAPSSNDDEEKKWRQWVDNHLVHMLSPNIYRNTSEALESFDYITSNGNFSYTEKFTVKYAGAAAMYFVSKKLKKKYNITDERASLYEAAETWVNALNGRDFLGGSKPNMADLAVFGVLRPIRYLRSGKDMVEHTRIGEWYSRMERAVGESARIKA
ncbi:hypothetical protein PRUPE_5G233700 [Prunus persica]|uniref:Uncharacterized protein n=1 Tax=Prunus persica TaxID=3760 RepID=M5WB50_PRUPE|nr:hypothetical protein PRUPE_5G233700 [Prunus persica]